MGKSTNTNKYGRTLIACYLGFVTQAITANFVPLLYLTFNKEYGISLGKLAFISTCFFLVQLVVDSLCAGLVDRIGYRTAVVTSEVASGLGLVGLAFLPQLLPSPYVGILICTIIYAIGSGLIEVLVSPIVEACPFENKESMMSLLHSFYCWGSVAVIMGSTLFFYRFGLANWRFLVIIWALIPLINVVNFAGCPIDHLTEEGQGMSVWQLVQTRKFWLLTVLMVCAGASELSMAQWASALAEGALHVSKTVGDLVGPCGFAVCMGLSRVLYSRISTKVNLTKFMMGSGILCVGCYLTAALCNLPLMGLIGCTLCGFTVGIMWPGSISIASKSLPTGGTAMFALLALAGDLGGASGPLIVGCVSQHFGSNLRIGVLAGIGYPIVLVLVLCMFMRDRGKSPNQ